MLKIRLSFSNKIKLLLSLLLIFSLTACEGLFSEENWDWDSEECEEDTTDVTFKQVGYWMKDNSDNDDYIDDIDYSQLTHIIYAYIAVYSSGSLVGVDDGELTNSTYDENLEDIVSYAGSDAKVLISIGGSSSAGNLLTIAQDDDLTEDFIDNVIELVDEYGLDGVDLSWQFPDDDDEGEYFEDLVEALSDELWGNGYLFTIEVVSGLDDEEDLGDVIDSDVFDYVDFVNIRAFNANNDENEEDDDDLYLTTDDLLDVISYWTDRCLIQNKLVVGIPVYATADDDSTYTYAEVVELKGEYTAACDDDDRVSIGGDYYYFNAIPTVEDKTAYAQTYAGGVMLMSLDQDYLDDSEYSLLNAVYNQVEGNDSVCAE